MSTDPTDPTIDPRQTAVRYPFAIDRLFRVPARLLGIDHTNTWLELTADHLEARFGRWVVRTPLHNVAGVEVSGPYAIPRVLGPPRLSLSDRGLTFATNARQGLCITFREPVTGLDPLGVISHPNLTVTVADPERAAASLGAVGARRTDVEEEREEQHAEDRLRGMTARQLRDLARREGVGHAASLKKDELVDLLERELGDRIEAVLPSEEPASG